MSSDDLTTVFELSDDTPVYVISVAAQLSGLHPQTLRTYDRLGLVSPGRAAGRGRRYSLREVLQLREVQRLSQVEGVNLSGIKRILELEDAQHRVQLKLAELHAEVSQLRAELESTRAVAARLAGLLRERPGGADLVPVRGARTQAPASRAGTRGLTSDVDTHGPDRGAGLPADEAGPVAAANTDSPAPTFAGADSDSSGETRWTTS